MLSYDLKEKGNTKKNYPAPLLIEGGGWCQMASLGRINGRNNALTFIFIFLYVNQGSNFCLYWDIDTPCIFGMRFLSSFLCIFCIVVCFPCGVASAQCSRNGRRWLEVALATSFSLMEECQSPNHLSWMVAHVFGPGVCTLQWVQRRRPAWSLGAFASSFAPTE